MIGHTTGQEQVGENIHDVIRAQPVDDAYRWLLKPNVHTVPGYGIKAPIQGKKIFPGKKFEAISAP